MRRHTVVLFSVIAANILALVLVPRPVHAVGPSIGITGLLVDPAAPLTDAHDEFVRLHNSGSTAMFLTGYHLRIGPKTYPLPAQSMPAGSDLTITSAAATWSLVNAGGSIALLDSGNHEVESTTWPQAVPGAVWQKSDSGIWSWSANGFGNSGSAATPSAEPTAPVELQLTELLPDPAAPLTDDHDEFIEIYNSEPTPVDLAGYIVKTGTSLSASHTLAHLTVPAGGYAALKSADTKIGLANAGGAVAIFDPSGRQLGETVSYPKAAPGQSWAHFDSAWHWTTTPTPAAVNQLAEPSVVTAPVKAGTSSPATTGHAKAVSKSTKAPKTAASKAPKSESKLAAAAGAAGSPGGRWLLFALLGLTIAYVIYEFRYDLRDTYFRLRGYPGGSSPLSQTAAGRGSDRTGQRPGRGKDHLRTGTSLWARLHRRGHQSDLHPQPGVPVE